MVTGSTESIKLELTVDKAELEKSLGGVFMGGQAPAAPSTAAGAGALGATTQKPMMVDAAGKFGTQIKHLAGIAGIAFGITALVKGSQVLSTTMGALNSTLFALVDSFLAPLVPLLTPLIYKLGEFLPKAAAAGEATAEVIGNAIDVFGDPAKRGPALRSMGKDLLDALTPEIFGKDVYRGPTQQSTSQFEQMRAASGLAPLGRLDRMMGVLPETRRETLTGALGPRVAAMGGTRMAPELIAKLTEASNEKLATIIQKQATRTDIGITITADNIEEVVSKLRTELENLSRDTASRGPAGGG